MNTVQFYKEARACLELGLYPEAHVIYQNILDLNPRDPIALYNVGKLAIMWGKFEEAFICFSACANGYPGNYDFMLGLLEASIFVSNEHAIDAINLIYTNLSTPISVMALTYSEYLFFNHDNLLHLHLFEVLRQACLGQIKTP